MAIPAKVASRFSEGLKRFQPVLASAKSRDINESDTAVIVTDVLHELFGYDKYSEITSEHAIRGTYCDIAIKMDGKVQLLVEVKAIGLDLKDNFVKQAVDYAANQGVDWVVLTNGAIWNLYKVTFSKPIEHELVLDFNLVEIPRKGEHDELWLLSREGWNKGTIGEYHSQKQALSRYLIAAALLSEPVVNALRRELRRVSPDVRIGVEEIAQVLRQDVIKREVLDGEKFELARKQVARAAKHSLKAVSNGNADGAGDEPGVGEESKAA